MWPWRRRSRDHPDLARARAEREKSAERLETVREEIVRPLRERAVRNQFAELLRQSLEGGAR